MLEELASLLDVIRTLAGEGHRPRRLVFLGDLVDRGPDTLGVLRLWAEDAQARFGFLLDALRYGAPPHGGIAMGLDRVAALLAGRENIREVIAFPKATSGGDPLTGAPAPVETSQLRELGLRLA